MLKTTRVTLLITLVANLLSDALAHASWTPILDDSEHFDREVGPLLEMRCVPCHSTHGESAFDVTTRRSLLAGGRRGIAMSLDTPQQSRILQAIRYENPRLEMPPTGKLPQAEIDTIEAWILSGAPWDKQNAPLQSESTHERAMSLEEGREYWAYKPIVRPEVPSTETDDQPPHPIDAFIAKRLEGLGLELNPPANQRAWIVRATYDLIGLPPTPAEIQGFLEDSTAEAYHRVIERLLASPHYGEKWARHWMDVVRYAETDGYERDGVKAKMWRFRDYLIRSFNSDKPYDRFILEQLAGDELKDKDSDSLIATGFGRLQIWDDEPADPVQARADYIAEVLDTTSAAFLGTTMGCARCHDHKKDPILQSDYYRMFAFFNNITEPRRGNAAFITQDIADIPSPQIANAEQKRLKRIAELETRIADIESRFLRDWALDTEGDSKVILSNGRKRNSKDGEIWRVSFDEHEGWWLQGFDDSDWPHHPSGFGREGTPRTTIRTTWETDHIYLRQNFRLTEIPRYLHLSLYHDDDVEVHINGILVHQAEGYYPAYRHIQLSPEASEALVIGSNSIAVHCQQRDGGQYIDVGLHSGVIDREIIVGAALAKDGVALLGEEEVRAYKQFKAEWKNLSEHPLMAPYQASVIQERRSVPPEQFVHRRGNANVSGEKVEPGFPSVLGGEDAIVIPPDEGGSSGRRLSLAKWIASASNPLTARVMVNRVWQHHFGRGLVRTSSDFGQLGLPATHPELIDYLAAEFIDCNWSLKDLHRFIMTSNAYKMSSEAHEEGLKKDPINDFYWRFDQRRLTAEEVRDSILLTNGTLNRELYGPSIYTQMPEEVLATASKPDEAWGESTPDQEDRRSVYVFIKRSLREPFLESFDQAETDTPCPVRFITTVPTQALISLNSAFMQRESKELASRLSRECGSDRDAKIRLAIELVCCRAPTEDEVADHRTFVENIRKEHDLDEDDAMSLLCLVIYNLNEFYYLD